MAINFDTGAWMPVLMNIGSGIVVTIVTVTFFGIIAWLLYDFVTFNQKVFVLDRTGSSARVIFTRGRVARKDGVPCLELKGFKNRAAMPAPEFYMPFKNTKAVFFSYDGVAFNPIKYSSNPGFSEASAYDFDFAVREAVEARERYKKNDLMKWLGPVIFLVIMVLCFIMVIVTLQKIDAVAKALEHAAGAIETVKAAGAIAIGGVPPA